MQTVRSPAVAGLFYPSAAQTLTHDVHTMLAAVRLPLPNPLPGMPSPQSSDEETSHSTKPASGESEARGAKPGEREKPYSIRAGEGANDSLRELRVKALIVPHAGYVYSGAVAASAYATLADIAPKIRRVILLGPTHRVTVRGLALPDTDAFASPLGTVEIDREAAQRITHLPQVVVSQEAHALEHALEVQLPFLQTLLPDFKLLPLAVGMATPAEVAEVLELLWGGDETLVVISSDLSHYLPYDLAKQIDSATAQAILALQQPLSHEQACGGTPINGLILAAQRHHLTPHLLDLRNSGDTAGSHDKVVGYASFAFTEEGNHVH